MSKCPKCKAMIMKQDGCQHMTCSICNYEWCWVCGLPYKSIVHYAVIGGLACEFIGLTHFKLSGACSIIMLILLTIFLPAIVYFFSVVLVCVGIYLLVNMITCKKLDKFKYFSCSKQFFPGMYF
jgi:hypothetical protein